MELPQEILTRLDALAERLGTTVETLWPSLVNAVWYDALANLIIGGGFFLMFFLLAAGLEYVCIAGREKCPNSYPPPGLFAILGLLLCAITCAITLSVNLSNFMEPSAKALLQLRGMM